MNIRVALAEPRSDEGSQCVDSGKELGKEELEETVMSWLLERLRGVPRRGA